MVVGAGAGSGGWVVVGAGSGGSGGGWWVGAGLGAGWWWGLGGGGLGLLGLGGGGYGLFGVGGLGLLSLGGGGGRLLGLGLGGGGGGLFGVGGLGLLGLDGGGCGLFGAGALGLLGLGGGGGRPRSVDGSLGRAGRVRDRRRGHCVAWLRLAQRSCLVGRGSRVSRRQRVGLPGLLGGRLPPQASPQPNQTEGGNRRARGEPEERPSSSDPLRRRGRRAVSVYVRIRGARRHSARRPRKDRGSTHEKHGGRRGQHRGRQSDEPRSPSRTLRVAGRGPAADKPEEREAADCRQAAPAGGQTAEDPADRQRNNDDARDEQSLLGAADVGDAERHDIAGRVVDNYFCHSDHQRRDGLADGFDQLAEAERHRRARDSSYRSGQSRRRRATGGRGLRCGNVLGVGHDGDCTLRGDGLLA